MQTHAAHGGSSCVPLAARAYWSPVSPVSHNPPPSQQTYLTTLTLRARIAYTSHLAHRASHPKGKSQGAAGSGT